MQSHYYVAKKIIQNSYKCGYKFLISSYDQHKTLARAW
jgi:hypothetical protein